MSAIACPKTACQAQTQILENTSPLRRDFECPQPSDFEEAHA